MSIPAFCQPSELESIECELCEFYLVVLAESRRAEMRALYEVAARLHEHKARVGDGARGSLTRCGQRLGKNRTTLLRYAFVYQRIKPQEFEQLLSLSDAKGAPPAFWDLVELAELCREERLRQLKKRLELRDACTTARRAPKLSRTAGDEPMAARPKALPRLSVNPTRCSAREQHR